MTPAYTHENGRYECGHHYFVHTCGAWNTEEYQKANCCYMCKGELFTKREATYTQTELDARVPAEGKPGADQGAGVDFGGAINKSVCNERDRCRRSSEDKMSEPQELVDKIYRELLSRHMGDAGVCARVANVLMPIIRDHVSALVASLDERFQHSLKFKADSVDALMKMK